MTTRRLAAILFADIVGYTAMMQQDERQALAHLNKFKEELESQVIAHQGEIIQFYGDGCLAIFNSSVNAVGCAKGLQEAFQSEPKVPVRIGLHAGDVMHKEGNVYGDAVNIASRVESMGIPGAVLLSSNVKNQIKNQSEFELTSLGRFAFKNVEGDMSVYALANEGFVVPKEEDMKGKGDKTGTKKTSTKYFIRAASLGFIAMVLGASLFWMFSARNAPDSELLPEKIRESRIAVLPFENKTNDPELDVLGDMAADWITEGLMNIEELKVVSFQNIKDNIKYAEEGNNPSFVKATGAEKIIRGSFYQEGDEIIFQSRIVDASSGVLEKAMPQISGNKNRKTSLVKNLQQRVLGYFVLKEHPVWGAFHEDKPPIFEAYKLSAEAMTYVHKDNNKLIELNNKVIAIDSNYTWAYIINMFAYGSMGEYHKRDSLDQLIKRKKLTLTGIQQLYYDFHLNVFENPTKTNAIVQKILKKDPKNLVFNFEAANHAIMRNNPKEAVRICQYIDPEIVNFEIPYSSTTWFGIYGYALIHLNRLDEAMEILNFLPEQYEDFWYKPIIYAVRSQKDSIQHMGRKLESKNPTGDLSWFYLRIAKIYGILDDKPKQKEWAGKALNNLELHPLNTLNLAHALYLNEQYDEALLYYKEGSRPAKYGAIYDGSALWVYLSRIGCIYAKTGKKQKALEMIEQLQTISDPHPHGKYTYAMARIYAQLNEKEKATEYLKIAFANGFPNDLGYQNDIDLLPLFDYPPFEKFIKYRWKKVLN